MTAVLRVVQPIVQQSGRDHDYARKQWSGMYYAQYASIGIFTRAELSRQAKDSEIRRKRRLLPSVFVCISATGILRDVYIPRAELYRYDTESRNLNACTY